MTYLKTIQEKARALNLTHSSTSGWYALLVDGDQFQYGFTADAGTDTISASSSHNFVNGSRVTVSNVGGGLPGGLFASIQYRVINASTETFKLCLESTYNYATKTGTPINITGGGSGTHAVTEQPLGIEDDFDVWVKHEVSSYFGAGRQNLTMPAAIKDYASNRAYVGPVNFTFLPTGGTIVYRYAAIISGGTGTRGDATGLLAGFEDNGLTTSVTTSGKTFQYTAFL